MYDSYFGLSDLPFSIAPDPRYLYLSQQHREALAHLQYGLVCHGGFVLLTGEVGTGKTTVCRCLLEQVPEQTDLAFILNPGCSVQELLAAICQELAITVPEPSNGRQLTDAIHHHLLETHARGRQTVLIIDEAQNLSTEVLEQIRLLTNLETDTHKLLQIILLGQPELADKLKQPELRQLSQRITARYHLAPLTFAEMKAYIAHRLSVAGIEAALFRHNSLHRLYRLTGGVPRLINVICDRALLGAYVQRLPRVDLATLNRAAVEVLGVSPPLARWRLLAIAAGLLALVVTGGWLAQSTWPAISDIARLATPMSIDVVRPPQQMEQGSEQRPEQRITGALAPEPAPPAEVTPTPSDSATPLDPWQWPAALTTDLSQVMAYQHLFSLWGLDYDPTEDPVVCPFSRRHRLECAFQNGNLATVRQQNHPVIFRLEYPEKGAVYAILTRIDGERAELMVGGQLKRMSLTELAASWPHSYVLLWQLPPHYQAPLYPGSKGKVVAWLEQQMASLQERAPRRQHQYYDEVLVGDIRAFQRSKGLTADGIFGPQTSIYLSASLLNDLPGLAGQQEITSVIHP
ncbi:ExeA family protein [Oceanisphaera arctica]|uniref:Peptidoglycan-binding protein n=1 Tax=Oceanisphaera arctica TaxID=641510 RepID=A0A2P5TPC1_9GAMM|nr:AAA family ATPase [Oceanisphaera arctica]PPL17523.1 peptidoglycan-binding protein [Oceanisphaera arctica]GHA16556.1 ATPase AAA [Oceanisphaera arctica]